MNVIVVPPALDEAQAAAEYYRNMRPELEQAFRAQLDTALKSIGSTPQAWSPMSRRHRFVLLRRFPYKVVYRIAQNHVIVVAIAHTSRRPRYWRDR